MCPTDNVTHYLTPRSRHKSNLLDVTRRLIYVMLIWRDTTSDVVIIKVTDESRVTENQFSTYLLSATVLLVI